MAVFKKKEYVAATVPELMGRKGGLAVTIRNLPVRSEVGGSQKRLYPGFAADIAGELGRSVHYEEVAQFLGRGDRFSGTLLRPKYPEISVEISGTAPPTADVFYSDLYDAVVDAWQTNGIKR